jgi:hypothetical protein
MGCPMLPRLYSKKNERHGLDLTISLTISSELPTTTTMERGGVVKVSAIALLHLSATTNRKKESTRRGREWMGADFMS